MNNQQSQHPRNLDEDHRDNVASLPLPDHIRATQHPSRPPAGFLEQFAASIRHDPMKQIACTVRYMYFRELVQLAKEISALTDAPSGSDDEVLALKLAVKLDAWAEVKFPPPPAQDH